MALESRRRSGLKPWNGPLCAQIFGSSHCCHLRAYSVAWPRFVPGLLVGDFEECQRDRAPRVRSFADCTAGFDCWRGGAALAPKRSASMAKSALSSTWRLVFLDRRGSYRIWSALCCLGASSPREKLESSRHPQGRSRTRYKWPLRPGSSPHLYRVAAGICWLRSGPWRMARTACCSPRLRRTMAQTAAGREMDARTVRRVVRSLLSTGGGVGATRHLSAGPCRAA